MSWAEPIIVAVATVAGIVFWAALGGAFDPRNEPDHHLSRREKKPRG